MKTLLIVIYLQRTFINENSNSIVIKIQLLINSNKYGDVIFTKL